MGLVSAACLAKLGHQVVCVDINEQRIATLMQGECPIHEKELPQLLKEQLESGHLLFTTNLLDAIEHATIQMITVGTPGLPDDQADLSQIFALTTQIAQHADRDMLVVIKSTVPVGTGHDIEKHMNDALLRTDKPHRIDVISNPEFLCEGNAIHDFLHADRIIIGGDLQRITPIIAVYQTLVDRGVPIQCMSRVSAELTKYAANAMLACKISFINQISQIADKIGANMDEVQAGMSSDHRIGSHFLQVGMGYGGSCFPKDVRALAKKAKVLQVDSCLLDAINNVNNLQKKWAIDRLLQHFKNQLQGLTIGIWGLAFKPGTDDIREASSIVVMNALLQYGTQLRVYDPVAMSNARLCLGDNHAITWCDSADDVLFDHVDALVIDTAWDLFKNYSLDRLREELGMAPIMDGCNCFDLSEIRQAGIGYYYSVGRPIEGVVAEL